MSPGGHVCANTRGDWVVNRDYLVQRSPIMDFEGTTLLVTEPWSSVFRSGWTVMTDACKIVQ